MPDFGSQQNRDLWTFLEGEVVWLHYRWKIFRQLFGTSEARVDLLNDTAAGCFRVFQESLLDSIFLTLTRLLDGATTRTQENAVLEHLIRSPEVQQDPAFAADVGRQFDRLKLLCSDFRKLRNKRIAHSDLSHALGIAAHPLPETSREMVEDALSELRALMQALNLYLTGNQMIYEPFSTSDGNALIEVLKRGWAYEKAELEDLVEWEYLAQSDYGNV